MFVLVPLGSRHLPVTVETKVVETFQTHYIVRLLKQPPKHFYG